jgi:hypothetical protein
MKVIARYHTCEAVYSLWRNLWRGPARPPAAPTQGAMSNEGIARRPLDHVHELQQSRASCRYWSALLVAPTPADRD